MARPIKETVDYFPHDASASSGKTIFILESKFGNNGYAFWFKLLELLASSKGHYYNCQDPSAWAFLLARTHVTEENANEILSTLAELSAIAKTLWEEQRTIWCQNLVNNVADVYTNRRTQLPQKPNFYNQKSSGDDVSTNNNPNISEDYTPMNLQTKLEKTILNQKVVQAFEISRKTGSSIDIGSLISEGFTETDVLHEINRVGWQRAREAIESRGETPIWVRNDFGRSDAAIWTVESLESHTELSLADNSD